MNKHLAAPLLALICASCTLQVGSDDAESRDSAPETTEVVGSPPTTPPPTTNPPTTTTTTVYVPPPPPPSPTGGVTVLDCPPIGDMQTSEYYPDDWDVWCAGWLFGEDYIWGNPEVCDAFWGLPDFEIMDMWMEDGNDRDFAIGALDSLWMNC